MPDPKEHLESKAEFVFLYNRGAVKTPSNGIYFYVSRDNDDFTMTCRKDGQEVALPREIAIETEQQITDFYLPRAETHALEMYDQLDPSAIHEGSTWVVRMKSGDKDYTFNLSRNLPKELENFFSLLDESVRMITTNFGGYSQ